MGATVPLLPALGMPQHILYCPKTLIIPGFMFAATGGVMISLFFEGVLPLATMACYAGWHLYWAKRYRRDPWVVLTLKTRYQLGLWGTSYTKNLIKEKAWVYGA